MRKICNKCGFQQDEFLNLGGRSYCKSCNSLININSNQISAQEEKTAHQLKLALGNLRFMLEALEKFTERAYGDNYPIKSQIYRRKVEDDNYPLKNSEEAFLTQLLIMKGVCKNEPEFFRNEIKKEYFKWVSAVGINVNNCPDKLKHFLFEINEVLEDRGEKIIEENEARIKNMKFDPKGAIGLFGALQEPMNRAREEKKDYEGKKWNELGNENRFNVSDEQGEEGQGVFQQIHQEIAPKQSNFSFYPPQQRTNSEIIWDVKNNPQNWRLDEVITEYNFLGGAKEKKMALIHNSAQIGYDGSVLDNNQPVYLAQKFSPEEIRQINEAKAISQGSASSSSRYYYQQKADDKLANTSNQNKNSGKGGIIAIVGIVSILLIASVVVIKKRLSKKSR